MGSLKLIAVALCCALLMLVSVDAQSYCKSTNYMDGYSSAQSSIPQSTTAARGGYDLSVSFSDGYNCGTNGEVR